MSTLREKFKNYLVSSKLSKNTANVYACGVQQVCAIEGLSWEDLKKNIDTILPLYEKGGPKEVMGKGLNGAVICGLRKYYDFISPIRHKWTFAEDFICCVLYIKTYIIDKKKLHVDDLVEEAMPFLKSIPPLSVKEKFRNIKELTLVRGISDTFLYSNRENASKQNIEAFDKAYSLMI